MRDRAQTHAPFAWLFCGLATALGWGLRGEFGGETGAAIPGALLGLAIALTSRRPGHLRHAAVIGMAATLGIALGGIMSYGRIIGYTKGIDVPNVAYGFAMLGVVGGLWGAFGAGTIGLAISPKRYSVGQVLLFVLAAYLAAIALHWLLIDVIGIRMTPPRGDSWPQCLAAVLALIVFARIKRDALPQRLAVWGFVFGSLGFMIGDTLQVIPSSIGPSYDWWKVMEQSFGFILGAGIAWAVHRETAKLGDPPPAPYALNVFSVAVTAWLVPVVTFNNLLEFLASDERGVFVIPEGGIDTIAQFRFREAVLLVLFLGAAYAMRRRPRPIIATDLAAKGLFVWVAWACLLIGAFKLAVPEWSWVSHSVHTGFLAMAIVCTIWLILGLQTSPALEPAPGPAAKSTRPPLRVIGPVYIFVIYPLIALLALSIASHNGQWRSDAHVRFGVEPAAAQPPQ